ncbi:MAG: hypothetical protein JXB04_13010 [Kiritimatiellae bacterium]|nr:hypothetical protein [Kiritimatiellia bacterium]
MNKSEGSSRHQVGSRIVRYHFSRHGLRDSTVREDGVNILVLGDSFTFGWLLDAEDTYVARLQAHADAAFGSGKFNLLNAGAGGWGLSDYLAYLEDYGDQVEPHIVLVFLNNGDLARSMGSGRMYRLSADGHTLERISYPPSRLKRIMNAMPAYQWLLDHSHLFQLLRNVVANTHPAKTPKRQSGTSAAEGAEQGPAMYERAGRSEEAVRLGKAIFRRMNEWCKRRNIEIWVTTTGWHNPELYGVDGKPTSSFMAIADQFFAEEFIPFADPSPGVRPIVDRQSHEFIIAGDGHPNEQGARLIADGVWASFLESQLRAYGDAGQQGEAGPSAVRSDSPGQ